MMMMVMMRRRRLRLRLSIHASSITVQAHPHGYHHQSRSLSSCAFASSSSHSSSSTSLDHNTTHDAPVLTHCEIDRDAPAFIDALQQSQALYQHWHKDLEMFQNHNNNYNNKDHPATATTTPPKKWSPRQRIHALLDPGTPLLELSPLAGMHQQLPSAGIVTAIGIISGRPCMILANDWRVKGGTYFPLTVKKHLRAQTMALENKLPCIYIVDSGGAYLPAQAKVFPDAHHFGRIFYHQAHLSAHNLPQISVVCGSCTAGGAYVPSLSDETIMIDQPYCSLFLGGPPLVQAATGQVVSALELGGAYVHTHISGVADHFVSNEADAMRKARDIVRHLGADPYDAPNHLHPSDILKRPWDEPVYDPAELGGIVPLDTKQPVDIRLIIARIVDGSRFHEFKKQYGPTLVCGFAQLYNQTVGIVSNNGILFSESALKGAHFVQLCCQRGIPLLFVQNISGFMVGQKYEHEGIAKHGAKLVSAVATAHVPKLTLVVGGSYGAGNYGMCGRAFAPRFLYMWPQARIAVMGGPQAASVLSTLRFHNTNNNNNNKKKQEKEMNPVEEVEAIAAFQKPILDQFEHESSAYYSTCRLWDDGIIDPADTRRILGMSLHIATRAGCQPANTTKYGVFRM